jgi:tripartite-type tricarboxylate transporter receptor subunit TctC
MTTRGCAISRLVLLTATMLAAAPVAAIARSDYPNRTIKIVVPTPPGAILDILPRIIADKLSAQWGQSVVIENRPGAAQNLGAEAVAKAEPDGYTLLVTPPGPLVISQYYYPKLGFDPTAFVPVTIMVTVPPLLVVNPRVPVSTVEEWIAYAKANPNKMTYGSPGAGSTPQLAMEKLMSAAGIRLIHVPYQGLAPAQRDLIAGHIDVMIDNLGNALPYIKDAKLKLLAVTTEARSPELPDTPAISETLPGFAHADWFAVVAPPKTPPEITAKLSLAIAEVLRLPQVAERFRDLSVIPVGSSAAETAAVLKQDAERWRAIILSAGIKAD